MSLLRSEFALFFASENSASYAHQTRPRLENCTLRFPTFISAYSESLMRRVKGFGGLLRIDHIDASARIFHTRHFRVLHYDLLGCFIAPRALLTSERHDLVFTKLECILWLNVTEGIEWLYIELPFFFPSWTEWGILSLLMHIHHVGGFLRLTMTYGRNHSLISLRLKASS